MTKPTENTESTGNRKHLVSLRTDTQLSALNQLLAITEQLLPIFGEHGWNRHSLVTANVTVLSRLLYLDSLYKRIVDIPGVVCEFGVQWGATLTQLINLRSIYEPFNHSRTIYGFDTFCGFPSVHQKDGGDYRLGDLATIENYEQQLDQILTMIE